MHGSPSTHDRGSPAQGSHPGKCTTDLKDLQLPPAFCLPQDAELSLALEAAYEREFDQLP